MKTTLTTPTTLTKPVFVRVAAGRGAYRHPDHPDHLKILLIFRAFTVSGLVKLLRADLLKGECYGIT